MVIAAKKMQKVIDEPVIYFFAVAQKKESYAILTGQANGDVWNDPFPVSHWKSMISSRILAPNQC